MPLEGFWASIRAFLLMLWCSSNAVEAIFFERNGTYWCGLLCTFRRNAIDESEGIST
jgi:hypothetical protein